ncbi:MAG: GFA family protein [Boseongicola sp.]|nr:MAG: GFA family protein [Boseongicola sp.]
MLTGSCHCGNIEWTLDALPTLVTTCNCTVCRRYGSMCAYGILDQDIHTSGKSESYRRQDSGSINFHFCTTCGCMTHFIESSPNKTGKIRTAVNVRMSDPSPINDVPIRHFEGHNSFTPLPSDGRTVRDMWF